MTLKELLTGDVDVVTEWLEERDLLHTCGCSYTIYDPEAVCAAAQEEFGDKRADAIYEWAFNLSHRFGWMYMDVEYSRPAKGIAMCITCASKIRED